MTVTWPNHSETGFGKEILCAEHDLASSELFGDEGLASILDQYPRENLDIWTFGAEREGVHQSQRGRAPNLSGAEIVEAVKRGTIWLNLRRANFEVPDLKHPADEIYGSLQSATGQRIRKRDLSVLISSPRVQVHYHLDIPLVALFQLRGEKRIWMYPRTEAMAPSEYIEDIIHMSREEELPYRKSHDDEATVYDLTPGKGLTWPQFLPHRVQNADCMNVSLSCEYMTLNSLIRANAIYTDGLLRRISPLQPHVRESVGPTAIAKAAFARAHKVMAQRSERRSPTCVTFELDISKENCVRPLFPG